MGPERLYQNLARTLTDMKTQTGLEPGKPTGLCHPVVIGALTGREIRFVTLDNLDKQKDLEGSLGLIRYPVFLAEKRPLAEVVPHVLRQEKFSLDAILVTGTVRGHDVDHVIAVIPENNNPPYHVVDSLLPDARRVFETPEEVATFIDGRFETGKVELFIIPNEQ